MSKPAILLTELPWNVKKCITSSTDLKARMSLRKCSKEFKRIVKYLPTIYHKLEIKLQLNSVKFIFTNIPRNNRDPLLELFKFADGFYKKQIVEYHFHPDGCVIRDREWEKLIEGVGPIEMAVRDLETFVRKANVKVDNLHLSMNEKSYRSIDQRPNEFTDSGRLMRQDTSLLLKYLSQSLKRLKGPLSTRWFRTEIPFKQEDFLPVLQYLQPGTLETIELTFIIRWMLQQDISKIFDTEQWKKAKKVDLMTHPVPEWGVTVPAAALLPFPGISTIYMKFSSEEHISFVNAALKHGENFRGAHFKFTDYDYYDFEKYLRNNGFSRMPDEQSSWKVSIPASKWYLKVEAFVNRVTITAVDPSKAPKPKIHIDPAMFPVLSKFYVPQY